MQSGYLDPEESFDVDDDCGWIFENHGKVISEYKPPLPPRDDLIIYNPKEH